EESMMDLASHRARDLAHIAFTQNLPELFEPKLVEGLFGTRLLPGLNSLFAIIALIFGIALIRRQPLWAFWIAATILMMILVLPAPRYILAVLPLMAYAWWLGSSQFSRRFRHPWDLVILSIFFWIWLIPNGVQVTR